MPSRRITMQDIADACGLSRNTVSKVFNGRGSVPRTTRDLVLQKARELGYGTPVDEVQELPVPAGNIALLTQSMPSSLHFGSAFKSAFTDQISRAGYTLKMYEISPEELKARRLPPHFVPEQTAGIVGIELFDKDYINMICHLGIPVVMADGPEDAGITLMECDYVTMENLAAPSGSAISVSGIPCGNTDSVLMRRSASGIPIPPRMMIPTGCFPALTGCPPCRTPSSAPMITWRSISCGP